MTQRSLLQTALAVASLTASAWNVAVARAQGAPQERGLEAAVDAARAARTTQRMARAAWSGSFLSPASALDLLPPDLSATK